MELNVSQKNPSRQTEGSSTESAEIFFPKERTFAQNQTFRSKSGKKVNLRLFSSKVVDT